MTSVVERTSHLIRRSVFGKRPTVGCVMVDDAGWNIGQHEPGLVGSRCVNHNDGRQLFGPRRSSISSGETAPMLGHVALGCPTNMEPARKHVRMVSGQCDRRSHRVHVAVFSCDDSDWSCGNMQV